MHILERDFFTDPELTQDPAPYYAALRQHGPVFHEPHHGAFMVSGMDEIHAVYGDPSTYSAIVSALGPLTKIPEPEEGETVAEVIERRRDEIPMSDLFPSFDPPKHGRHRALLSKLLTPNRMKQNEEFMWGFADRLIDEFADSSETEFSEAYAIPFSLVVIADLLGVPLEQHQTFRDWMKGDGTPVAGDIQGGGIRNDFLFRLVPFFTSYIEERRTKPADDVLGKLAAVRFPDGELPDVIDVVRIAVFLFAAGHETTARLITTGMHVLAERPSLVEELRKAPESIPNFVEECLRFDSPVKGSFRLALSDTQLAGVDIPAGSVVMTVNAAVHNDPQIFENPERFDARRPNARRNLAFGHGEHFCPGANLARTEARISFERLLARLDDFQLVDPSALSYAPTFLFRGLNDLPLRFRRRA